MRLAIRILLGCAVGLFLLLFLILPVFSLVLTGFTGEPVNPLRPDLELRDSHLTLQYYKEFFELRRYRQGLLNSVGLAPLCAVAAWLVGLLVRRRVPQEHRKMLGIPWMGAAFGLAVAWAVAWPWVTPHSTVGPLLCPGPGVGLRILQALGFCPLVTLAATALGVSMAFCVSRTAMPGAGWIRLLAIVPLCIPPFLAALSFKILVGDAGILTNLLERIGWAHPFQSQSALSAGTVQAFLLFPLVLLTTSAALERMDPSLGEAAGVMGARRGFAFWTVHLPVLAPGITAGAFLVFIRSFGDFGALKLLMPSSYPMLVVEAYRDLSGNVYWGGAAMLSTLMIGVILTLLALQKYFVESGSYQTVTGRSGAAGGHGSSSLTRYGALLWCLSILSVPFALLATTFLISLAAGWGIELVPQHYTLARYGKILSDLLRPTSPLINSVKLVLPALLGATGLSFTVAYLISRSRHWFRHVLDFTVMLPFVVPGVAFAVALIGAFNNPPLALHFTPTLVILAYIVTRMPYGVRSTLAS
ncbi:MAG: ABC transporter permease subunit, partial [Candidatus Eremiobacterota bacterium]